MSNLLPLMLVPLIVWLGVWAYLMGLDAKVKRLQREMRTLEGEDEEE